MSAAEVALIICNAQWSNLVNNMKSKCKYTVYSTFHDLRWIKAQRQQHSPVLCYLYFSALQNGFFFLTKIHFNSFQFLVTYKMHLPSYDQGGISPQGTFLPHSAACMGHCSIFYSSKWVRNLSLVISSCEQILNFMHLKLPYALNLIHFVLPCCSLPPLHGQFAPHHSAQSFPQAGCAVLSLCEWTEQGLHVSVTALPHLQYLLAKGFEKGENMNARQLLRSECVVAGKGVALRQGVWRRQSCKGKVRVGGYLGKHLLNIVSTVEWTFFYCTHF